MSADMSGPARLSRRRVVLLAPLGLAVAAGTGFYAMLTNMGTGEFDPHDVHAPVLNRPIPQFDLPSQAPGQGFSSQLLSAQTQPVLVNFFASWCIPCVLEAQTLVSVASLVPIWGVAYKDASANAAGFVRRTSAPYAKLAADRSGLTAIDWGVTGVPESFLIAPGGIIRWHVAGPLTADLIHTGLRPALASLHR
ncbi:redoxin domain-containing protein [Lichenicoccus sp.]|uniref:redoxin domain-containing protein n=1 Tax=Lichenicoccus sp. TaxID=2781899 RepID=UPI003D0F16EA